MQQQPIIITAVLITDLIVDAVPRLGFTARRADGPIAAAAAHASEGRLHPGPETLALAFPLTLTLALALPAAAYVVRVRIYTLSLLVRS